MDDSVIYVNAEGPWAPPGSRECCSQGSGHAHQDLDQDKKTRHAVFSGSHEKRPCRGAAVFLALLSFLLLVGLTTVVFLYTENQSESEKQRALLVALHANLTSERNQFLVLERQTELLQQRLEAVKKNNTETLKLLQGWVYFSGSFYQVSSTKKNWDQSRNDCQQKGANLLIINSREEQAFAYRFEKYIWIGLTDVANEGSWKWVDGTTMSTSYWASGEPNGKKSENCVDIKNDGTEASWNDESCSTPLFWICEKKVFE